MTQPVEAVGGTSDTVIAAEPTLEDRFAAVTEPPPEEEEPQAEAPAPEASEEPQPEADLSEGETPDDSQPIPPPVSWTAEEKEEFSQLPRALQETLTRREAQREKFVQGKAQEAAQTRNAVERQALDLIQQRDATYMQQLQALLPQIPERPSHYLQAQDPMTYAAQMDYHESAVAQYQFVQQQIDEVSQRANLTAQAAQQHQNQLNAQVLQDQFPEFLDPAKSPDLKKTLSATGQALGYSNDQLVNVDAQDILAMRTASEWKVKADKYDALMSRQMQNVRDAKAMPRVSRPGTPQKGVVANQRYEADRQAMRSGDKDAATRVFAQFLK